MIYIVPCGKIERKILSLIASEVAMIFNKPTLISRRVLGIPKTAYVAERDQYYAEFFLKEALKSFRDKDIEKILAVTKVNIFTDDLNFVFGVAQLNGRAALISLYMLDPRNYGEQYNERLFFSRIVKEAVHELGHTYGLRHCKNLKCVMSFSNSVTDVDRKAKDFCDDCRVKLVQLQRISK